MATLEIQVPDIGDFDEVTVIELLVKPGDTVRADVRIVAATNKDLRAEVSASRFREDLFYRLNVIAVTAPPLRARRDDIPLLVDHFLGKYCKKNGRPRIEAPAPEPVPTGPAHTAITMEQQQAVQRGDA